MNTTSKSLINDKEKLSEMEQLRRKTFKRILLYNSDI